MVVTVTFCLLFICVLSTSFYFSRVLYRNEKHRRLSPRYVRLSIPTVSCASTLPASALPQPWPPNPRRTPTARSILSTYSAKEQRTYDRPRSQLVHNTELDIYHSAHNLRRTGIICTIGPASRSDGSD